MAATFGTNYFGVIDYLILIASLVICLCVGGYYAYFSKQTNEELLVGGRSLRILPVSASIMVSFFSAVTILGFPAEIYSFGVEIFCMTIFQSIGIATSAYFLVPFFYPMRLTSIYEYLELRYESLAMRRIGAFLFILEQMARSGLMLYAPALALESFLGLPIWISVVGIGVCGTIYTSMGGLKAVVWTDSFQFVIMVIGLLGIVIKGFMDVGGVSNAFSLAYKNGRLKIIDFTVDPFMRHNFLNFVLGSGFVYAIRPSVHQIQVQRYMSLPNVTNASRALLLSCPLKIFVMAIMVLTGISLYAANAGCDPVLSKQITNLDQIVTLFVVEKLAVIPGSLGLFTACICSAVLSTLKISKVLFGIRDISLSSLLNSLAAVTWEDYLSRMPYFASMGPKSQTNVSRTLSLMYGILSVFIAFTPQYMGAMYNASYAVAGVSTGAICAIFSMGVFMPFVNKIGAAVGVLTGLIAISYISVMAFIYKPAKIPLPVSVENCTTMGFNSFIYSNRTIINNSPKEFPENLYALSYVIYPFVGLAIAISVALPVSLLTGGFKKSQIRKVDPKYIHPCIRKYMHSPEDDNLGKELQYLNN